jgi:hypothetical protein
MIVLGARRPRGTSVHHIDERATLSDRMIPSDRTLL